MINFCTLFDSNYLDKGLALYRSIEKVCHSFCLYIYCFDEKCFDILLKLNLKFAKIVYYKDIETKELLNVKAGRSKAEYCWTCTPITIEYSLDTFNLPDCTYIDSDMYFYSNPIILFDEIEKSGADIAIMPHRFYQDNDGKKLEERNGKYCVEFNYFKNNKNGRVALNWWKEKCIEWCYDIPEKDRMGDQKYLNQFPVLFKNVCEIENQGAGVAPWNLRKYELSDSKSRQLYIVDKNTGELYKLIFYHFQNIRYINDKYVNIKSQTKNKVIKYNIYIPYLMEIENIRKELSEKFGLDFKTFKIVRSSNKLLSFLQKYFAALKITRLSDIIDLEKLENYL